MAGRESRSTSTLDLILTGLVIAAVGVAIVAGNSWPGWIVVGLGSTVTSIGVIGMGVRIGMEEAVRRRQEREAETEY